MPNDDGIHFRLFNTSQSSRSTGRNLIRRYDQLDPNLILDSEMNFDIRRLASNCKGNRTKWTKDTAESAYDIALSLYPKIYIAIPILKCRHILLNFVGTQVFDSAGEVVGVRDMCDKCESNKFVSYVSLRVNKPVHGYECKGYAIDLRCACRNPECSGFREVVAKKAVATSLSEASVLQPQYLKKNTTVAYHFSNISERLMKLYPSAVASCYQLHNRARGMLSLRLRRSIFVNEMESHTHARLTQRYHEHWLATHLRAYVDIVRSAAPEERRFFKVPPKTAPHDLLPMSISTMNGINDTFWTEHDRERIVATIQSNVPRTQLSADWTFELARLGKDFYFYVYLFKNTFFIFFITFLFSC